jgi:hypothetical protein
MGHLELSPRQVFENLHHIQRAERFWSTELDNAMRAAGLSGDAAASLATSKYETQLILF